MYAIGDGFVVRQIMVSTAVGTTLTGSGTEGGADGGADDAQFKAARGLLLSPDGATLYVAETFGSRIRRVTVSSGAVTTFVGDGTRAHLDGTGTSARVMEPIGLAMTSDGDIIYFADHLDHRLRRIEVASGVVTTIAGTGSQCSSSCDGNGQSAGLASPHHLVLNPANTILFWSDLSSKTVRQMVVATGTVTTIAGSGNNAHADGVGASASFRQPLGMAISGADPDSLYVGDLFRLRKIALSSATVTTVSGDGSSGYTDGTEPTACPMTPPSMPPSMALSESVV